MRLDHIVDSAQNLLSSFLYFLYLVPILLSLTGYDWTNVLNCPVAIVERLYPFPSRTRKSSSLTPMILTLVGNVGCCRTFLFLCNIQKSLRLKEFIRTILTHIKKAVRNIAFIPNVSEERRFFYAHESFAACSQILVLCKIIYSL